ncbi:Diphthamide biosynthesis protein 1 [Vanrija albida]|uniref:2-(3-amino-3-carboxypropyl)histidine synthase subunit 1 n=1 Tax=Vanrija albida TaxID=181172 RepID=A0ABR3Q564_9TREE
MAEITATEGIERPANPPQAKPRKRFVGTSARASSSRTAAPRRVANQVPDEILNDPALREAMKGLPSNYNFEIPKTIHHVRKEGVKTVALQMPEGLMMYGCAIADIVERFTGAQPLLLADVTYGACCIDDFTAREMGAEMIVHYGHSCLIPVNQTSIKTLYIFVEIAIDTPHLCLSVRRNFPSSRAAFQRAVLGAEQSEAGAKIGISLDESEREAMGKADEAEIPTRLALVGTIQFVAAVQALRDDLDKAMPPLEQAEEEADDALAKVRRGEIGVWRGKYEITVPQIRPLSPGEILGCTAPKLGDVDALIYVGDGRFHLESIMIANPSVPAFRFDPYSKKFTREYYEHDEMRSVRADAVRVARRNLLERGADSWAILLGTLGRQGSLSVMKTVAAGLPPSADALPPLMVLLSEVSPAKLGLFSDAEISTFVQTSCPRLSIDWGYAFKRPLLSSYEASVAAGRITGWHGVDLDGRESGKGDYPMDYYADGSLGPWTPRHQPPRPPREPRTLRVAPTTTTTPTPVAAA